MKLAVFGAGGRMGRAIVRLAQSALDVQLVGAVDAPGSPHIGKDAGDVAGAGHAGVEIGEDAASALLGADVAIEFTVATAFDAVLRAAVQAKVPLVSGTTRLSAASEQLLTRAAEQIPV